MRSLALPLSLALTLAAGTALSADFGTPEEAKAMLEETVTMMKSDPDGTIAKINAGEMTDRDLYPYCGNEEGMFSAHPNENVRKMSLKELKDKAGKAFGEEIYTEAAEGEIAEVSYMWPRPNETEPVQKVAYVTKIGDQICAVGFYK